MLFSFLCRLYPTVMMFLFTHFTTFSMPVGQRCLKLQIGESQEPLLFHTSCLKHVSLYNCMNFLWQLQESLWGKVIIRDI